MDLNRPRARRWMRCEAPPSPGSPSTRLPPILSEGANAQRSPQTETDTSLPREGSRTICQFGCSRDVKFEDFSLGLAVKSDHREARSSKRDGEVIKNDVPLEGPTPAFGGKHKSSPDRMIDVYLIETQLYMDGAE
ncbi:hypothetical protein K0M31_010083 [Melipona bicolor]|uniref:Uncharacterized protein n=1 Tax=Melipona bicolor TaxID=60889 RepID=A0AA40FN72_9HYME|nr:hypothetical protein K0M31_010083 [Melipona bicolor]